MKDERQLQIIGQYLPVSPVLILRLIQEGKIKDDFLIINLECSHQEPKQKEME